MVTKAGRKRKHSPDRLPKEKNPLCLSQHREVTLGKSEKSIGMVSHHITAGRSRDRFGSALYPLA